MHAPNTQWLSPYDSRSDTKQHRRAGAIVSIAVPRRVPAESGGTCAILGWLFRLCTSSRSPARVQVREDALAVCGVAEG
jgi:hypothetical protein